MFKNVWVDRTHNQVHLWSIDGSYKVYDFKFKSYEIVSDSAISTMRTVDGRPVRAVYDTFIGERTKMNEGVLNCEADIQPEIRFLSDFYSTVENLMFNFDSFNTCYIDIEVESGKGFPSPEIAGRRVNLITSYSSKSKEFVTFGLEQELLEHVYVTSEDIMNGVTPDGEETCREYDDDNGFVDVVKPYIKKPKEIKFEFGDTQDSHTVHKYKYIKCDDEVDLFVRFFNYFENEKFDIISGWNCLLFDIPYIIRRCMNLNIQDYKKISPIGKVSISEKRNEYGKKEIITSIAGVSILDMLLVYKKVNLKQRENYKLSTIANIELGVDKKDLGPDGFNLYKRGQNGWSKFVQYNVTDVEILVELDRRKRFLESVVGVCADARIPLEYFFVSKRVILGFMMHYMHSKGIVIPNKGEQEHIPYEGAYIVANPGSYKWVVSYDFKSMYPSIIASANISPETKYRGDERPDRHYSKSVIKGIWYDNSIHGIIPEIVSMIVDDRDKYKALQKLHSNAADKANYDVEKASIYKRKQEAYKIYANSIYGLLGNRYFQFYDVDNAASVTGIGRYLIQYCIDYIIRWFDLGLPRSEQFKHEFGEYANVEIKGYLDDEYIRRQSDRDALGKYKRLVLAHTDSFFLDLSDIYSPFIGRKRTEEEYKLLLDRYSNVESVDYNKAVASVLLNRWNDGSWSEMTITEFALRFEHCVFSDVRKKILEKWSKENNYRENKLWLKLEKCCTHLIELSRSHYICNLQYDEGDDLFQAPFGDRFKAVGVDLVKADTPIWSKIHIKNLLEMFFKNVDKNSIIDVVEQYSIDFRNRSNIANISKPVTINTLDATKNGIMTAYRKGSNIFNTIIDSNPEYSKYEHITEGTKAKWLYVKYPNKFETQVITFNTEKWPQVLDDFFTVDYDTQFEKVFKAPLKRILDVIGWGDIFEGGVELMSNYEKVSRKPQTEVRSGTV